MAILSMAIYDTGENKRAPILKRCLDSVLKTVDFSRHRICLVVNSSTEESCERIFKFLESVGDSANAIWTEENVGTARAINKAWLTRKPGEHAVKMDDDVFIQNEGWADEMEEAISYDPKIGIIGLKRKDCWENTSHPDPFYRSELCQLPHTPGHPWIIVEKVHHVIGTCQMYNSSLLDKIGFLYQPGLYGWDDVLAAARSEAAGFYNCFLPHFRIDHIDTGDTPYQGWKERIASKDRLDLDALRDHYKTGKVPVWYGPNGEQEVGNFKPGYSWNVQYSTR